MFSSLYRLMFTINQPVPAITPYISLPPLSSSRDIILPSIPKRTHQDSIANLSASYSTGNSKNKVSLHRQVVLDRQTQPSDTTRGRTTPSRVNIPRRTAIVRTKATGYTPAPAHYQPDKLNFAATGTNRGAGECRLCPYKPSSYLSSPTRGRPFIK